MAQQSCGCTATFICQTHRVFTQAATEQSLPSINQHPAIQDLVMQDMEACKAVGIQRYGTLLQPHNGRDALLDLYQELLDACNYVRQVLYERDGK